MLNDFVAQLSVQLTEALQTPITPNMVTVGLWILALVCFGLMLGLFLAMVSSPPSHHVATQPSRRTSSAPSVPVMSQKAPSPPVTTVSHEEKKRMSKANEGVVNELVQRTQLMEEALSKVPKIQAVEDLIRSLTPDQREKLAGPVGVEFQGGMVALTSQQIEAVRKFQEMQLRNRIALGIVDAARFVLPAALETELETFLHAKRVYLKAQEALAKLPHDENDRYLMAVIYANQIGNLLKDRGISADALSTEVKGLLGDPGERTPNPVTQDLRHPSDQAEVIDVVPEPVTVSRNGKH